ncbi:DUF1707 domain-containing protein [Nonomuraea sp. NPDC050404]|uniref:DUF1707 SHOCT-like domain-containing protein n=1 Tax=Nonomuraea sp. NPDC050404 TaxID=3155783 RepID=UPI00340FE38B
MDRKDLRIGDAEREQTMAALREHFALGRLTHEELDERLDRTLAAKTGGELAELMADLPGQEPAYREPAHPHEMGDWRAAMHAHRQQMQSMRQSQREMRHAAWAGRRGQMRHRRGPHPILPMLFVLMIIGLFVGGSGIFKVLLAVWLGAMLFTLVHRAFHYRR